MREFTPMVHSGHGWDEQYNNDVGLLFSELAGAKANSVLNVYAHSKTGNAHTLTGEGAVMRFFAKAPWTAGDTVTVNGESVNPVTLDGAALPTGGFVSSMWVVAVKDGKNLQFLTQSYAGVFADIQTQLANKVNKTIPKWYDAALSENYGGWAGYTKNDAGTCFAAGAVSADHVPVSGEIILVLPEGFRPGYGLTVLFISNLWYTFGFLNTNGTLHFTNGQMQSGYVPHGNITFNIAFPSA